jgi:hypothetical protein
MAPTRLQSSAVGRCASKVAHHRASRLLLDNDVGKHGFSTQSLKHPHDMADGFAQKE